MSSTMADLIVRDLTRRFASGGGISDVSFTVSSGEFFVLLGPSGCGKSTLLRLIAGLEQPDHGSVALEGNSSDPRGEARGEIAMVFQNFALYPNMTAFGNIAFPLRLRRAPRAEIEARVNWAAETSGLSIDLRRYPAELSGGERQRVALARALVREPAVILMDEPLSSLDAKLRAALRLELRDFQRRTRRTIVYVTHDQAEAFALADRIAVVSEGRIEQIGTPEEIYGRPATAFVAGFVGSPPMNLIRMHRDDSAGLLVADGICFPSPEGGSTEPEVTAGFRATDFATAPGRGLIAIELTIEDYEFTGSGFLARGRAGTATLRLVLRDRPERGQKMRVFVDPARLNFFDTRSGKRLR